MDFITVDFDKSVNRRTFDCVSPDLNDYIVKYASQDQKRHLSRTFLALGRERTLLGYYMLASTSVRLEDVAEQERKRLPRYPLPAVLLSRLAVDRSCQRQGLGQRLLADVFRRLYAMSKHAGIAFLAVDAKDEAAARYYKSLGFESSDMDRLRLVYPTAPLFEELAHQDSSGRPPATGIRK